MPTADELYYHIYEGGIEGEKSPVILIHGAGGTHLYWPSEMRRLPRYRVYALDLPGHGKSGGRGQQSIPAYAQAVLAWLEQIGIHRAVFVGHSMGAAIALSIALDYPEHVIGLGLVSAAARLIVNPIALESAASPTTFHQAVQTLVSEAFSPQTPEHLVELAARRMEETRPSVLHGDLIASEAFDVSEQIMQIQQPVLVVCGADDRITPQRSAQFLADKLPAATLEIIPNAGHMVMLEQTQAVESALLRFLNQLPY